MTTKKNPATEHPANDTDLKDKERNGEKDQRPGEDDDIEALEGLDESVTE